MKITIERLVIETKRGKDIAIDFPKPITFFYGKVGAGKSTIPRLIDYCFGGNLVETPALQQEFLRAKLVIKTGEYEAILSRNKNSGLITVLYKRKEADEWIPATVPAHTYSREESIIEGEKVENISDFIFHLAGRIPPFVRRSKTRDETDLIRLSFRDMLWYCYLSQEEIDSSFFNLGKEDHDYKRPKSRDVMRLLLGYHREEISRLEIRLDDIQKAKNDLGKSVATLKDFLEKNGIQDAEAIEKQIANLNAEYLETVVEIERVKETVGQQTNHIADSLKEDARKFALDIVELNTLMEDLNTRISREEKVRNEYISASIKDKRANTARAILKDVAFERCPQCGASLASRKTDEEHCSLCTQSLKADTIVDLAAINEDLRVRINELDASLAELGEHKRKMEEELRKVTRLKTSLDSRLMEMDKDYDSKFLSQARELERRRGEIEAEISSLKRLHPLPKEVYDRERQLVELALQEDHTQQLLNRAIDDAESDKKNIRELESLFLDTLIRVGLPGVKEDDYVVIDEKDFIPVVKGKIKDPLTNEEKEISMEFSNLGSGGKRTIFKASYALAIQRFAVKNDAMLPRFLIMDTPMKNISERENNDIFKRFYEFVYEMAASELKDVQIIVVDKEHYEPPVEYKQLIYSRHMTPDDQDYPPLIDYYGGY